MAAPFWDERYSTDQYVYGKEPNSYFKDFIDREAPGRLLLPGEGEGRNAVYAALKGWDVTAFDQSQVARRKALNLAKEKNVTIDYLTGTLDELNLKADSFDCISLIFFHLPEVTRQKIHHAFIDLLKKGGKILIEVFHKDQFGKSSGGPNVLEMLYDTAMLANDFKQLKILELKTLHTELDEGPFHQGDASLLRMIAEKT